VVTVFFNQKGNKMATPFPNPEQKTLLFNMLKVLGGHRVVVNFAGGGDSGSIDEALLLDQYGKEIDCTGITIEWTKRVSLRDSIEQDWVDTDETKLTPVLDVLRDATEIMLEESGLDWYNNEGGQGSLRIQLDQSPPSVVLNVGVNTTTTDDHEFDYTDDEEEDK
jgi:hypothetical protein